MPPEDHRELPFQLPDESPFVSDFLEAATIESNPPPPPGKLTIASVLAWIVVIAITLFLSVSVAISQLTPQTTIGGDVNPMELAGIQLQGRALVGQSHFTTANTPREPGEDELGTEKEAIKPTTPLPDSLDTGPYEQRLCYSILVNELSGPEEANAYLESLDTTVNDLQFELTEDQTQLRSTLGDLYSQYVNGETDSTDIPEPERELLVRRLEWLGELALLPSGTPQSDERDALVSGATLSVIKLMIVALVVVLVAFASLAMVITLIVFAATGKLRSRFETRQYNHGIYIETFAIWISLFFGSSIVIQLLGIESQHILMMLQLVVFFGSLMSLGWPVIRGIPFSQVRQDIGWTSDHPVKEALMAIPAYLASLPFLIPGIIVAVLIMGILSLFQSQHEFARQASPGHPIQEYLMRGDFTIIVFVLLTACVAAPIVEETMFRGVLYRHLRDLTGNWQRWISIILAAIINGMIFASIHPQGLMGIPLLASLAICFSLTREWRNSLIAPMFMHGIHNTLITCLVLFIL